MIKAAIITSFCLLALPLASFSQDANQEAIREGIRRQYNTMVMRDTLKKADDADPRVRVPAQPKSSYGR